MAAAAWAVQRAVEATATVAKAKAEAVTDAAKVVAAQAPCLEARARDWAVAVWAAQRAVEVTAGVAATAAAAVGWVPG